MTGQRYAAAYTLFTISAVILAVCSVMTARATGSVSHAAVGVDTDSLIQFLIFLTVIKGIQATTSALTVYFRRKYAGNTGYTFRDSFIRHFLALPFSDFEKKNGGEMLSVYSSDIPKALTFVTNGNLNLIRDIISVLATLGFMFTMQPFITLIYCASFPVLAFMQIKISAPLQKSARNMSQATAKFNSIVNDSLQNTSTVAAYSLEAVMEKRYLASYDDYYKSVIQNSVGMTNVVFTGFFVSALPVLFAVIASGFGSIDGNIGFAEFVSYSTLALTPIGVLTSLAEQFGDLKVNIAGAESFAKNIQGETEDIHKGERIGKAEPVIKFENVTFSYGGEGTVPALDNVSFEIKAGERIAFIGGSGSGKSTVLKLILGLYKPQSGRITISGRDIREISKTALRSFFAYVPQDCFMFPESIGENILCVNPETRNKQTKLENSCSDAGILKFINSLPGKFDTVLSESAENISGGQRQRLAIARAFYKDAPAALFDEVTSALDPSTEDDILKTMETLMEGRTVIMVAHRAKAVTSCDTVAVMKDGHIVAIGKHEEMLNNESYASLYSSASANNVSEEELECSIS